MSVKPYCSSPGAIASIIIGYVNEKLDHPTQKVNLHLEQRIYLESLFKTPGMVCVPFPENSFNDPVSFEPLNDCVITPCGHTFNKKTLEEQFRANLLFCPLDRNHLNPDRLYPNNITSALVCKTQANKVFLEIRDSVVSTLSPSELDIFNKRLFSKIHLLDWRTRSEEILACDFLKYKKPVEEYLVTPDGGTVASSDLPSSEGCIPNRIFQQWVSWSRSFINSNSWINRKVETLPNKPGLFLYIYGQRTLEDIVQELAICGVFKKEIQYQMAHTQGEKLAAIDKFRDLEEFRKGIVDLPDGVLNIIFLRTKENVLLCSETPRTTLYSIKATEKEDPHEGVPYIRLILEVGYLVKEKSFCNPDLIPESALKRLLPPLEPAG